MLVYVNDFFYILPFMKLYMELYLATFIISLTVTIPFPLYYS